MFLNFNDQICAIVATQDKGAVNAGQVPRLEPRINDHAHDTHDHALTRQETDSFIA
jgi:hypothetical protein